LLIALSYEHKISGLLEILDFKENLYDIKKLGINQPNINETVDEIEKKVELAISNQTASQKARAIANNCLDAFVVRLQSILDYK
jgi:colanic acid/amylovoran biosynthesis protein